MDALVTAFIDACSIEQLSKLTISRYLETLTRYRWWCETHHVPLDPTLHTKHHIREFLRWLQSGDVRWSSDVPGHALQPSTVQRYWAVLSRWYNWLVEDETLERSPMATIRMPRARVEQPDPFSAAEIQLIIAALQGTTFIDARNRAIVAIMLDAGLRRSEVAALQVADIDFASGDLSVRSGKGDKPRRVRLGSRARRVVRRYYLGHRRAFGESGQLFTTAFGTSFGSDGIRQMVDRLGIAAGVPNCHAHRFRHTFAISAVRAGIGLLELQSALGHTSLEMVRRYVKLAEDDIARSTQKTSPMDHMKLDL